MFNATNARTKADAELEEFTDAIAAEYQDRTTGMTTQEKKVFTSNLLDLISSADQVSAFTAGTYAQNSAGQPAAAISAGSPSDNGQSAVDNLREQVRNSGLPQKVKIGVENLINPNSPAHLHLDADGTPSLIAQLKSEKEAATAELARERDGKLFGTLAEKLESAQKALNQAQEELKKERDPNHSGSLAQQLAAAVPYDRAALRAELGELQTSIQSQSTKRGSKTVDGNGRVMDSFTKVVRRLGFQPSS